MEHRATPQKSERFIHSLDAMCASGYQDTREKIGESSIVRHSISKKLFTQYVLDTSREGELGKIKNLRNRYVLQVVDISNSDGKVFVISEFASTHSLFLEIIIKGRLEREEALSYFAQICTAVGFLHSKGIVHGNLLAENIILDKDNKIKITEYGIHNQSCSLNEDIQALGTVLQQMLSGCSYSASRFPVVYCFDLRELIKCLIEGNVFRNVQEVIHHKLMEPYIVNSSWDNEGTREEQIICKLERYLDSRRKRKVPRSSAKSEQNTHVLDSVHIKSMNNITNSRN